MLNVLIIAVALLLASYLALSRRLAGSSSWKATVTPLASIMGSGFLVSAPLLAGIVGTWALACMAVLLLLAYFVGDAIRFNIRHFEPIENASIAIGHSNCDAGCATSRWFNRTRTSGDGRGFADPSYRNQFSQPRIVGKVLHLHPVMVLLILVIGEHFFGIWGLLLGVPIAVYLIRVVILKEAIPGIYEPDAHLN